MVFSRPLIYSPKALQMEFVCLGQIDKRPPKKSFSYAPLKLLRFARDTVSLESMSLVMLHYHLSLFAACADLSKVFMLVILHSTIYLFGGYRLSKSETTVSNDVRLYYLLCCSCSNSISKPNPQHHCETLCGRKLVQASQRQGSVQHSLPSHLLK